MSNVTLKLSLDAHPASEHFPMLSEKDFTELKADIQQNGLLEPIWLFEGKILDGRNRYRACVDLGIEPATREYQGNSPIEAAWSLNGQRRHLTTSQRAAIAVEMLPVLEEEARKRQEASRAIQGEKIGEHKAPVQIREPTARNGHAVVQAACIVGVGETNVQIAKKIKQTDPAAFEQIKAGTLTVGAVRAQHRKSPPPAPAGPPGRNQPREQRVAQIRELAREGHRSEQIAEQIHTSADRVRFLANEEGIPLPDALIGKTRRINARRVIEETVSGLEGFALGISTIDGALTDIGFDDAQSWIPSLNQSIKTLTKLRNKLSEIARG